MNNVKFVLDTNLLLSSALFKIPLARQALNAVVAFEGEIILSQPVLDEINDVFSRSRFDRYLLPEARQNFLNDFLELADIIEVTVTIADCRDPKDNKFLELAISGKANYILTNDKDLLVLNPYQSITVITPSDFLANL